MISRDKKETIVETMRKNFAASAAVVIVENQGLTAAQMARLRRRLRECDGRAQVVKNTLAQRALAGGEFAVLGDKLGGPLIYGFGGDPSGLAKTFAEAARGGEKLVIRGGALSGNVAMDAAAVKLLASLPARDQLLTALARAMQAPMLKFAQLLGEMPAMLARVLRAVADEKNNGNLQSTKENSQ